MNCGLDWLLLQGLQPALFGELEYKRLSLRRSDDNHEGHHRELKQYKHNFENILLINFANMWLINFVGTHSFSFYP